MRLEFGGIWIITFKSFKDILVNLESFIGCNYVYNNSCVCVCCGGEGVAFAQNKLVGYIVSVWIELIVAFSISCFAFFCPVREQCLFFFLRMNSNLTWVHCSSLFTHCSRIKKY